MKLFYNGIALHELGELRILSIATERETRRERVVTRVALDHFNRTYALNKQKIDTVRTALRTSNAPLLWQDDDDTTFLSREVFVAEDGQPDNPNAWGTYHQSIEFSFWYYRYDVVDPTAITCSFQAAGSVTVQDMGNVFRFADAFGTTRFHPLRDAREDAMGNVTVAGRWVVNDALEITAKRTALLAKLAAMNAALNSQARGALIYGTAFNQTVRVVEFVPQVDEVKYHIDWTLTARYTRFPDESNYAVVNIRCTTRTNAVTGATIKVLGGSIGAPTIEAAQAKLDLLRTAFGLTAANWVRLTEDADEQRVDTVSAGTAESGDAAGKGVFIQLGVSEEWQQCGTVTDSDIVNYEVRKTDEDDVRSGFIRTQYAGRVMSRGSSYTVAFNNAVAKAQVLGAGKYPMLLRSLIAATDVQRLSSLTPVVNLEFSYEYQRRGDKTFYELNADLETPTFGNTVESISGNIAAPDYLTALTAYNDNIRSLYAGALILNERQPSATIGWQQKLAGEEQWDRFTFSLQVHRAKPSAQSAISYVYRTEDDWLRVSRRITVQGTVWSETEASADAAITAFLAALAVSGNQVSFRKEASTLRFADGLGTLTGFMGVAFTAEYDAALTGLSGTLMCEVTEDVTYTGGRIVERPNPDNDDYSTLQRLGNTVGQRTISATCVAVTEAAARAWVQGMRTSLLALASGSMEIPPRISTSFEFVARQATATPRGGSANYKVARVTGQFGEMVPNLPYA